MAQRKVLDEQLDTDKHQHGIHEITRLWPATITTRERQRHARYRQNRGSQRGKEGQIRFIARQSGDRNRKHGDYQAANVPGCERQHDDLWHVRQRSPTLGLLGNRYEQTGDGCQGDQDVYRLRAGPAICGIANHRLETDSKRTRSHGGRDQQNRALEAQRDPAGPRTRPGNQHSQQCPYRGIPGQRQQHRRPRNDEYQPEIGVIKEVAVTQAASLTTDGQRVAANAENETGYANRWHFEVPAQHGRCGHPQYDSAGGKCLSGLEHIDQSAPHVGLVGERDEIDHQQRGGEKHGDLWTDWPAPAQGQASKHHDAGVGAERSQPLQSLPVAPVHDRERGEPEHYQERRYSQSRLRRDQRRDAGTDTSRSYDPGDHLQVANSGND